MPAISIPIQNSVSFCILPFQTCQQRGHSAPRIKQPRHHRADRAAHAFWQFLCIPTLQIRAAPAPSGVRLTNGQRRSIRFLNSTRSKPADGFVVVTGMNRSTPPASSSSTSIDSALCRFCFRNLVQAQVDDDARHPRHKTRSHPEIGPIAASPSPMLPEKDQALHLRCASCYRPARKFYPGCRATNSSKAIMSPFCAARTKSTSLTADLSSCVAIRFDGGSAELFSQTHNFPLVLGRWPTIRGSVDMQHLPHERRP